LKIGKVIEILEIKKKMKTNLYFLILAVFCISVKAGFENYDYGGRQNKIYIPTGVPVNKPLYV
jgi:hypothetical protein